METDDKIRIARTRSKAPSPARSSAFIALKDAFNAMESAHQRGDYSRSPGLQQRLKEFRSAASEVHRLAIELRLASGSGRDTGPLE